MNKKDATKKLRTLIYTPKCNIDTWRQSIDKKFSVVFLPNHVEKKERTYGEVNCDVLSPEIYSSRRVTLYIHGGCFVGGSKAAYREFCALLANKAFTRVVIPDYSLAPEAPFPKAIEDVQRVFHFLFTEENVSINLSAKKDENGEPLKPEFIIAADGAGCNIALSLLQSMQGEFKRMIKRVVLFSPWLNLSQSTILGGKRLADEILSTDVIAKCRDMYTNGSDTKSPLLSPLLASPEVLKDFPSVYMQIGSKEILLNDARAMSRLLQDAGVSSYVDVFPEMPHLFQLASDSFEMAHTAIDRFAGVVAGVENSATRRQTFDNKPPLENSIFSEA